MNMRRRFINLICALLIVTIRMVVQIDVWNTVPDTSTDYDFIVMKSTYNKQPDTELEVAYNHDVLSNQIMPEEDVALRNERPIEVAIETTTDRPSRGGNIESDYDVIDEMNLVLSFYTSLAEENGGYEGRTATSKDLAAGMVASGRSLSFGAKFVIPEDSERPFLNQVFGEEVDEGEFVVEDRMHESYARAKDGTLKLDVYVPRKDGESSYEYLKRVNNMGLRRVKAKVIQWSR